MARFHGISPVFSELGALLSDLPGKALVEVSLVPLDDV